MTARMGTLMACLILVAIPAAADTWSVGYGMMPGKNSFIVNDIT